MRQCKNVRRQKVNKDNIFNNRETPIRKEVESHLNLGFRFLEGAEMTSKVFSGGFAIFKPYLWRSIKEVRNGNQDPGTVLCKLPKTGTLSCPSPAGAWPRRENRKDCG
jgi:hypothetical protein